MAQVVEHILGKDEVTGSTPVISSMKSLEIKRFRGFSYFLFFGFVSNVFYRAFAQLAVLRRKIGRAACCTAVSTGAYPADRMAVSGRVGAEKQDVRTVATFITVAGL